MAIVVKADKNDNTNDVIKKFKKQASNDGIADRAKNRQYHQKDSQYRAEKRAQKRRLKKRARSLKEQKNVPDSAVERIYERIDNQFN